MWELSSIGLVWLYGISVINVFNAKSCLCIYIKYMIWKKHFIDTHS